MHFTRRIDDCFYMQAALGEARQAYNEYCVVHSIADGDGATTVTIEINPQFSNDAKQVILEFWNFFLDSSCKLKLENY